MRGGSRPLAGLYLAVIAIWLLFDWVASSVGSVRGEAGPFVCAVVLLASWAAAWVLTGSPREAIRALGLGKPRMLSLWAAAGVSVLLIGCWLIVSQALGVELALLPGYAWLVLGMLAQGGIAEEVLFRGLLFGQLRENRPFWRAALLSVPPFLAVHVLLFFRMEPVVAATATLLSLSMSFPLARLYDLGGSTVWAAALLHGVVQATIKVVALPAEQMPSMAGVWMLLAMLLPWSIFAIGRTETRGRSA